MSEWLSVWWMFLFTNIRDLLTFVIHEHSWFTNVRDLRTFVIYECSWFMNGRDLQMFVIHEHSWLTNVRDSQMTRCLWTARCVKPLHISVDFAAFMFRVVICPTNTRWTKVNNQATKSSCVILCSPSLSPSLSPSPSPSPSPSLSISNEREFPVFFGVFVIVFGRGDYRGGLSGHCGDGLGPVIGHHSRGSSGHVISFLRGWRRRRRQWWWWWQRRSADALGWRAIGAIGRRWFAINAGISRRLETLWFDYYMIKNEVINEWMNFRRRNATR